MAMARSTPAQKPRGAASSTLRRGRVVNSSCGVSGINFRILVRQWGMDAVTELSALSAGWYSSNHDTGGNATAGALCSSNRRDSSPGSIMRMGTQ